MRYPQVLEELGFSPKESAVYLALLAIDSATVTEIAQKAEIRRTTCYEILDSLLHKGLVTKFKKRKKIYFSAGDPRRLLSYLEREKEESIKKIELQKNKVSEVMVELLSLLEPKKNTKPKVEFYEGEKGMREAYEDTLTSEDEILAYANVQTMHEGLPHFFPEYYARRTQAGVKIKAIMPENTASLDRAKKDKEEIRESAFFAKGETFSPEVNIYNNKMLIASWKEKMAVIIESKELADLQRVIYKIVWDSLKKK